jgi:tripartite-type tricarboxylate transporter receptor subunit TctC
MSIRTFAAAAAALLLGLATAPDGMAQGGAFPQRPIRLVAPFAAGGNTDLLARITAAAMGDILGQQVVVENKTGSGSLIAAEFVAKSTPDGYTLLINSVAHAVGPALFAKLPFDPVKSFAPIALVATSPLILVVNAKLGVKDVQGLLALARKEPGKHSFGTGGNGSVEHLSGELFKHLGKLDVIHVPYRGGAPALADLVAGQISFMSTPFSAALPHVKGGALVGLAASTAKRVSFMPDLPTVAESGVPGYDAFTWNAVYAPAGTPQPVVERLNQAINQALGNPAVVQKIKDIQNEPTPGTTPDSLAKFLASEMTKWQQVIKTAGITPE